MKINVNVKFGGYTLPVDAAISKKEVIDTIKDLSPSNRASIAQSIGVIGCINNKSGYALDAEYIELALKKLSKLYLTRAKDKKFCENNKRYVAALKTLASVDVVE